MRVRVFDDTATAVALLHDANDTYTKSNLDAVTHALITDQQKKKHRKRQAQGSSGTQTTIHKCKPCQLVTSKNGKYFFLKNLEKREKMHTGQCHVHVQVHRYPH